MAVIEVVGMVVAVPEVDRIVVVLACERSVDPLFDILA